MTVPDRLDAIRGRPWQRWGVTLAGGVIGVLIATTHWLGFVIGGALVALPQRTRVRGVLTGVGFGAVVWGLFLVTLALDGAATAYLEMDQVFHLSLAIPVVAAFLGSLVRVVE